VKSRQLHLVVLCALALGLASSSAFAAGKGTAKAKAADEVAVTKPAPYNGPVDLNGATKEQLMSIPEITSEYADKIIEGRPYREKISLRRMNILPIDVFYAVDDKLVIDPYKWKKLYEKKQRDAASKKN
jgi:DNA uptake protein ComE-like DNA-binding protein